MSRVSRRMVAGIALGLLSAACGGGSSTGTSAVSGKDPASLSVLVTTENTQVPAELRSLAANQCKSENSALPLAIDQTPSANMNQKVQLLAGQNALPVIFASSNSLIKKGGDLQAAGKLVDIQQALTELGVADTVTSAAQSTITQLYSGESPTIPFQYNIEGIFYNKQIFADNGITAPPTTWAELVADAGRLKANGVTPFTASGKTGWTISRWVGAYTLREDPQALEKVAASQAKLTDPAYVKAAQAIADLGKAGYFNAGVTSTDYNTENAQLLTGKAAMMYMGSWFLASVNDPTQNKVGNAIGFMPFPTVPGGTGRLDQYPANVGAPTSINKALFGPKVAAWLKCIAKNYGSDVLKNQGAFSGFKLGSPVASVPPLTQDLQKRLASSTSSVLWFEALFNVKATADSGNYAAPLLTGGTSAQDYMKTLQTDLETA